MATQQSQQAAESKQPTQSVQTQSQGVSTQVQSQQPIATTQQATSQTPQPPAIVESATQAFNPLNGVHLTQELMPYAYQLAAPYDSFVSCFKDKEEGRIKWHSEIEYAIMMLTSATAGGSYLRNSFKQNPLAFVSAVKLVAMTGLSLNPTLKQAYLVPFKGVISFMPSYQGMTDMLIRTGLVKSIEARLVYTDDMFEVEFGANRHLIHKPNPFSKKRTKADILGGYWYAVLPDGSTKFDTMSFQEIVDIQKRSPSGNSGPWATDFSEMAKKTVIRRSFKSLPHIGISDDNAKVLELTMSADNHFFYEETKRQSKAMDDFDEDNSSFSEFIPDQPQEQQ